MAGISDALDLDLPIEDPFHDLFNEYIIWKTLRLLYKTMIKLLSSVYSAPLRTSEIF